MIRNFFPYRQPSPLHWELSDPVFGTLKPV